MVKKLSALAPLLASGWFVYFLFLANRDPKSLLNFTVLSLLLPVILIFIFVLELPRHASQMSVWFPTLALLLSLPGIFIFLDRPLSRQFLIGGGGLLVYLSTHYLYLFVTGRSAYVRDLLKRINLHLIFLSIFFSAGAVFAWSVFIAQALWPLLMVIFLTTAALAGAALYEDLSAAGKSAPAGWLLALIIAALSAQFFWALNLWPVGFLIKGAVFSLIIGFLILLAKDFLLDTFNRRRALKIFSFCFILAAVVLFLARWV